MRYLQTFTIGMCTFGLCYLGADEQKEVSMTPAENQAANAQKDTDPEMWNQSPMKQSMERSQKKFPTEAHKEAYKSLSPKNQAAYDTLPEEDKDHIAEAHKNGENAQEVLGDILADDQDSYEANPPVNDDALAPKVPKKAPAAKAMENAQSDDGEDEEDEDADSQGSSS